MTKSASSRFSASGTWLLRIASNFSAVMPGRASTRSRCTSGRRRDDDDLVDPAAAASRRAAECRARRAGAARAMAGKERLGVGADKRMDDLFQPLQRLRLADDLPGKQAAIDRAVEHGAGKGRLDAARPRAGVEPVHGRVGIVHRDAARRRTSPPSSILPMPIDPVRPRTDHAPPPGRQR